MTKRLPKEIQDALDGLEPMVAAAFLDAFDRVRSAIVMRQVEEALLRGDITRAIEELRLEGAWFSPLHDAIRASLAQGGGIALAGMAVRDPFSGSRYILGFDGRHIRAEEWVSTASAKLIAEVIEDQKSMVREAIRRGLEAGKHPRAVALDIVGPMNRITGKREGGLLGLTSQQARWAANAEDQLRNLDAGYLDRTRRDRRFDATVRRAIREGKPLSEADIRRIGQRYRDRLLKMRGDTIGRTEALNALRAGRHEGFLQLIGTGKVRADQVTVTWSATMDSRTRDTHRDMNGQGVSMGGLFTSPSGARFAYPGDVTHGAPAAEVIQCRCIASYRIKNDLLRDEP